MRPIAALKFSVTLVQVLLVLAAVPAVFTSVFMGTPYLVRVLSHPWAWSWVNDDSLTGSWVGTLHPPARPSQEPPDAFGKLLLKEELARLTESLPETPKNLVMIIRPGVQFFTWSTHLSGSADTCESGGARLGLDFTMGDIDDAKINLALANLTSPAKGGGWLDGLWSQGALSVEYQTLEGEWQGNLHKGSGEDFERACAREAQSKRP
ncbi:MAG: hypothetical protein JO105_06665 [Hyphomicrobiales bacterium]|nr:hypothetical protein [Hyphomicrobiales bacterium]